MLAKPIKSREENRVTKTMAVRTTPGGTAWTKRTQGSEQAVGRLALSRGLKQPRKCEMCEADLVTSRRRQHSHDRNGKAVRVPPGSSKIVACSQRSEAR